MKLILLLWIVLGAAAVTVASLLPSRYNTLIWTLILVYLIGAVVAIILLV